MFDHGPGEDASGRPGLALVQCFLSVLDQELTLGHASMNGAHPPKGDYCLPFGQL